MHSVGTIERIMNDEVVDLVRVEGGIIAGPLTTSCPSENCDALHFEVVQYPIYDRIDVMYGIGGADQRSVRGRRLRHFGRTCRASVASNVHHIDYIAQACEVLGQGTPWRRQIKRG
jgi:hypothetical protein